jgi:hypothetical protein
MKKLLLVIALLSAACGDKGPTAPSTPPLPNLSGTWTGNLESSNWNAVSVQVQLSQTSDAVSGSWTAPNDWNGTVSGTVSTSSFAGTVTLSAPNALGTGPRCTGTSSLTAGNVGPASSTLTITGSGFSGSCAGMPQNIRFVVQKR